MAFQYFKPDIWTSKILQERERYCVGVNLCDRSYESEVKDYGQAIVMNWTKRPTIRPYIVGAPISPAETLDDGSATLSINQLKYFNVQVDDVDEAQSKPDVVAACMRETAMAVAEDSDNYIYTFYSTVSTTETTRYVSNTALTSANALSTISQAAQKLYEANVPMNETLYLEVPPIVMQKIWLARILHSTDNKNELDNGFRGMVDNFKVYMTNGIKSTLGTETTTYHCLARTKKALAFAGQVKKTEAYRLESAFSDAIKGLHVYGGAVQRPKELIRVDIIVANETAL